jgi:hypothetical protein
LSNKANQRTLRKERNERLACASNLHQKGFAMHLIRTVSVLCLGLVAASSFAQFGGSERFSTPDGKVVRRIKIRHADPEFIMRMLMGSQSTMQPEWSTILNISGNGGFGGSQFGGGGNNSFGGGNSGIFGGGQFGNGSSSRSGSSGSGSGPRGG